MHPAAVAVILCFVALFAGLTLTVIANSGLTPLSILSLLLLALIAIPVIGAMLGPPPDE
jgi:hypothetical protein